MLRAITLGMALATGLLAQIPTSGLVFQWNLVDSVHSTATTAADLSGNGFTGTITPPSMPFLFGTDYAFAATSGKRITNASFAGSAPTATATVVVRAYISSFGTSSNVCLLSMNNGGSAGRTDLFVSTGGAQFDWGNNSTASNSSAQLSYSNTSLNLAWHSWVIEVAPGSMTMYLDGTQVATKASSVTASTSGGITIGDWITAGGYPLIGVISDVEIYSRSLTGTEITGLNISGNPLDNALIALPSNGLALTPPMCIGTWYDFGPNVTEANVKAQSDGAISTGLQAAGYNCVALDGGAVQRTGGVIVGNPSYFPDGLAAISTYIHNNGQAFQFYGTPNDIDCQGQPGQWTYEYVDVGTYVGTYKIDRYKYDHCGAQAAFGGDNYPSWPGWNRYIFQFMGQILQASGRPVEYGQSSVVGYYPSEPVATWGSEAGINVNRIAVDSCSQWSCVINRIDVDATFQAVVHPGYFNDPDYLQIGLQGIANPSGRGIGNMTTAMDQANMSLFVELAAPLMIPFDVTSASSSTLQIAGNADAIAIDQDSLGIQGTQVSQTTCGTSSTPLCEVYAKPLSGGFCAIVLFNQDTSSAYSMTANFSTIHAAVPACGAGPFTQTMNVWAQFPTCPSTAGKAPYHCGSSMGTLSGSYTAMVPANSAILFTVGNPGSPAAAIGSGFLGSGVLP